MTPDDIVKINQIYEALLKQPLEIYNAFIDYFGEDRVDMIYPSIDDVILAISDYDINIKDAPSFIAGNYLNNFNIITMFPHVRIENEKGMHIDVDGLWVKTPICVSINDSSLPLAEDNISCLMSNAFTMTRSVYKMSHLKVGYMHSHCPGVPFEPNKVWMNCCLGTGPIRNTVATLCSSFDIDIWKLYCIELERYVSTESLTGGPYRYMSSITEGGYSRTKYETRNNISYIDTFLGYVSASQLKDKLRYIIIDFIRYYTKNNKIPISFSNISYCLGEDFFSFYTSLSKSFIEWYNNTNNPWNKEISFRELSDYKILVHSIVDNNTIYSISSCNTNGAPSDYNRIYALMNNKRLFTFKGSTICVSINDDLSTNDNTCFLLNEDIANYIITQILKFINIFYGK